MPRKPKQAPIVCEYFSWYLRQKSSGVYYADGRINSKYDLGKPSLGTRDRVEALRRLRALDLKMAIDMGLAKPNVAGDAGPVGIAEGWSQYFAYCGRSPVLGGVSAITLQRYSAVRNKHVDFCNKHGVANWNDFDKHLIEKYGNWISRKHADRTVHFELTLLKSVNAWLIKEKKIPAECKIDYPLRKPQGTDTYCYTASEVAAMVKHCMASPHLVWLGGVIIALAHLGVRIGELAGLRWSDISPTARLIRVADERSSQRKSKQGTARTTKGKRSRVISIHPRLRKLLMQLPRHADGRIFHARRGGILRRNNVRDIFIREVIEPLKHKFPSPPDETGFEHGRIHSFRHFFCSQAFLGGASESEIREWLGHRDSKMVEHYRHLRNEDAQRKMAQIDFIGDEGDDDVCQIGAA